MLSKTMKPAARRLLISLVGLVLTGCSAHHEGDRSRLLPREDSWSIGVEPANESGTTDKVGDGNTSAVIFVEFVPTPQDVVERMLEMARVTKDDVVCDLGCGDGRIVSHEFAIGDLTPDKTVEATSRADGRKHTIYLWTRPLASENQ